MTCPRRPAGVRQRRGGGLLAGHSTVWNRTPGEGNGLDPTTAGTAAEMAAWAAERCIDDIDGLLLDGIVGGPSTALLHSGPSDVQPGPPSHAAAPGGNGTHVGEDPGPAAVQRAIEAGHGSAAFSRLAVLSPAAESHATRTCCYFSPARPSGGA